ncbi:MAG TPA: pyridoxal kinase PdxY [Anaeromyxobacteraceae bacterium]|nr:pyridoxal kinase PdxY [Anaeromyxobacteraceae bacterium]
MTSPPLVLSIQSHVAFGHAGNAAAVFPLQRLGVEAVPIHTVQFSNHTGHGAFRGQVFGADHVRDVVLGLRERGVLPRCSAVLSGYLGDPAIGEVILETVEEVRRARPGALWCCDPVMGDVGRGLFVRPGIPEFFRDRAASTADVLTPNQFELETILGRPLASRADAVAEARALVRAGRRAVAVTSLRTPDVPEGRLETLGVGPEGAFTVDTPFLPLAPPPNGMGDVFSAVFLARLLAGAALPRALEHATSALYGLVKRVEPGARDLPLVAAQGEIVAPAEPFTARAV